MKLSSCASLRIPQNGFESYLDHHVAGVLMEKQYIYMWFSCYQFLGKFSLLDWMHSTQR